MIFSQESMVALVGNRTAILDALHRYGVATPIRLFQTVATGACIVAGVIVFRYRSSIRKQLAIVDRKVSRGLVYRDTTSKTTGTTKVVKCLELHPKFVSDNPDWQLCSMGEYLSTLRFFTDDEGKGEDNLPEALKRELHVAIGSALLQSFGPRVGGAMLPMLGINKVDSLMGLAVSKLVSWVVANVFVEYGDEWDPVGDLAAMPLNVSEIIGFVNLNQKLRTTSNMDVPPLEWMQRGEIGFDPTYHTPPDGPDGAPDGGAAQPAAPVDVAAAEDGVGPSDAHERVLIPNPFVVEEHFERAISGLEDRIRAQASVTQTSAQALAEPVMTTDAYDPEDRSLAKPHPVNPTILPGLHVGWGDAKCTHTKREILRNRLFAVLLNKLSYNYQLRTEGRGHDSCFVVRMGGKSCYYPDDFVEALIDTNHSIEVCPRSATTTFGLAACVKEEDDSWTNIPVAFFFRTGYERYDQRPAYFYCPHGGVDVQIQGPLVGVDDLTGKSRKCNIQFYMAIEGMCGWHSNHNADVPWVQPVSTTAIYTKEQALTAIRVSGLLACTFNSIGTEMDLPFGGYGVLGVCNDTAALVDCAVRGSTNMYPLLSTGRFLMHVSAHLVRMWQVISHYDDMKQEADDTRRLAKAACFMESDIHCSPSQLVGAARRYLANYPTSCFQLTADSREVISSVSAQYETFLGGTT